MTTLKERLEEVMQEHGLKTQQQLAEFAGVSKGLVGQWFKGDTGLGAKPLLAFETKTNFSTRWLVEGKGDKYRNEPNHSANNVGEQENNSFIHAPNNSGTQNNMKSSGSLKTMPMPDDSFAPLIPQGSELTYNTSDTTIRNGKIYLIQQGEQIFIRRAFPQLSGSLKWACENKAYGTDELPPNAVQIVGRVVAWKVED